MLSISLYNQTLMTEEEKNHKTCSNIGSNSINDKSSVVYNEISIQVLDNLLKRGDNKNNKSKDKNKEDEEEQQHEYGTEIDSNSNKNFINKVKPYFYGFAVLCVHVSALIGFRKMSYYFSS